MPRPRKCRKVCCLPKSCGFIPITACPARSCETSEIAKSSSKDLASAPNAQNTHIKSGVCKSAEITAKIDMYEKEAVYARRPGFSTVIMTVDEYETIRLIDNEGFSQEECGKSMNVARTTVQQIYNNARKKIALALVESLPLKIQGGDYQICEEKESNMNIAVTYENGEIFQHFGHTKQFKLYKISEDKIIDTEIIDCGSTGHGALAGLLSQSDVDILICGGIGGGAQTALAQAGIKLYGGVSGDADEAVNALLKDSLQYNPDVKCNHHGSDGHSCHDGGHSHNCHNHGGGHICHNDKH